MIPATIQPPTLAAFLFRLAIAVSIALLSASIATALARRASAAVRHRLWSLATSVSLLAPIFLLVLPEHRIGIIASTSIATQSDHATLWQSQEFPIASGPTSPDTYAIAQSLRASTVPPPTPPPTPQPALPIALTTHWLWLAWSAPALLLLVQLLRGTLATRALVRRSIPIHLPEFVDRSSTILESASIQSPICVGWFRSKILLPQSWRSWPADQLRAVLTHESAHVVRRDVLWQGIARLACALYWPHPLVWLAARKMRLERELACDDCVVRTGQSPTQYARWLLDLACELKAARALSSMGVAMALQDGLKHRVQAALDPARPRMPVSKRFSAISIILAVALLLVTATLSPLKALQSPAQDSTNAVASNAKHRGILLVTAGAADPFLQGALESIPNLSVLRLSPADYEQSHPQNYSLAIFDHYTPHWIPQSGKFVYVDSLPPVTKDPAQNITAAKDPQGNVLASPQKVVSWNHDHPILKSLSLDRLWVENGLKLAITSNTTTLVEGANGPLIVLAQDPARTNIVIAFDLTRSSWPLDLSFPVFWHHLVQFLAPQELPQTPPAATQSADVEVPLIRFLIGHVVDPSGKPVPAARVSALFAVPTYSLHNGTADADGRFVIPIDPRKPLRFVIRADSLDGSLQTSSTIVPHRPFNHADFDDIHLTLQVPVQYPVIVTDNADHPIPGATVFAVLSSASRVEAKTDASGKATLRVPATESPSSIFAHKDNVGIDYASIPRRTGAQAPNPTIPSTDPANPLHLILNGTRTVTVKVTDFKSRPLAGAKVSPRTITRPNKPPLLFSPRVFDPIETDSTGTAKIPLPADIDRPVIFTATFSGYASSYSAPWDPTTGDNTVSLVLKPMASYHLTVLNPDGSPAPNADIMMVDDRGTEYYGTFNNGRIGATGTSDGFLNPDTFYMFAAMKGKLASEPVMQVIHAGGPLLNIELKLKPAVRVHGQLTVGSPPTPLASKSIYIQFDDANAYDALLPEQKLPADLTGPRGPHPAVSFNRPTDANGNFELYLAPGTYHLIDPANPQPLTGPGPNAFIVPNEPDFQINFHYNPKPTPHPAR